MKSTVFDRYPTLKTLIDLVPKEIIEREISSKENDFLLDKRRAQKNIKTVLLNEIFPKELERESIILENFLGHWGNVTIEELCKICLIAKFLKPKRVLEIGTYNGLTTLQIALNIPLSSTVYTLDLPLNGSIEKPLSPIDYYVAKKIGKVFHTSVGSYFKNREDLNIIQLWGDSAIFDYSKIEGKAGLIFIDAAHDYLHKKKDSEKAFDLLAKKGVILWHNLYDIICPDVTKYLADISSKYKIYHLKNTTLAVYIDN